jgi:hypothetical protein
MPTTTKTLTVQATDTDGFAASQTIAVGSVTLNGALASSGLSAANILTATVTGDQTGATLTLVGTNEDGNTMTEAVTLSNGSTTNTTRYFKTLTSATVSGTVTAASTIIIGHTSTNGFVSASIATDWRNRNWKCGVFVKLGTSGTYTVQHTKDAHSYATGAQWLSNEYMTGLTTSDDGNYAFPVRRIRLLMTAQVGAATITVLE